MKKPALTAIALLLFCNVYCQNFTGCIEIDFEQIPGQTPQEGLEINNQYLASHGVSFILENGQPPLLAEVGGVATAFSSVFGADQPAPGFDIGSFFLTDNGTLAGLEMIPVIVNFQVPVDSFSACILDIDFGEYFIIEAMGENSDVILSDTIVAGDPNTGDGVPSCWGFNFDGCEGIIYSVRFIGFRELPGGFGLGMDNFSFCFAGVDIANQIAIETDDPICDETTGTISLVNLGDENYSYSLDGINFQNNPVFENLPVGFYSVIVQDEEGCEAEITDIEVMAYDFIEINTIASENTTCGEDNGSISISSNPSTGNTYSLDGINFQTDNTFFDVPAGLQNIFILDAAGCPYAEEATIIGSTPPEITIFSATEDACNNEMGTVFFTATEGSAGAITFAVNGINVTGQNQVTGLGAGDYELIVSDADGCFATAQTTVVAGAETQIELLEAFGPDCDELNGEINVLATGGHGNFIYTLNTGQTQSTGNFTQLPPADYSISIIDAMGCITNANINVPIPTCPVFIPNVFSPNLDGINDNFTVFTHPNYDVTVLQCQIFDRWGELIWEDSNFTLHTFQDWWKGTFRGKPALQGVYVYVINVLYNNGKTETFSGDVTLIR